MYVLIDNSSPTLIELRLSADGVTESVRQFDRSVYPSLPEALRAALAEVQQTPQDLSGVAVTVGHGRFTATRVAVTVVNTLAFALGIPVAAVPAGRSDDWLDILTAQTAGTYVLPEYSGPPRLGGQEVSYDV